MTLEQDLERGARAERLLRDETFQQAFEDVRQALFHKIEQTPMRDDEGLKQLRMMLKLLKDVRGNVERAVKDGKLAAAQVEIEKERGKVRFFR